jgi:hypothetical protein
MATPMTAGIIPRTIVSPRSGERLDLHEAIWVCFARAKNQAAKRQTAAAA